MDTKRLNINFSSRPSAGYHGSESVFDDIESLVERKVPPCYFSFIREADGGHPEVGSFIPLGGAKDNWFEVDLFYSFGVGQGIDIRDAYARWQDELGKHTLPIGQDGGGNQIYLDLADPDSSVWLYLHDEDSSRIKVAQNFEAFVSSLQMNPDFI